MHRSSIILFSLKAKCGPQYLSLIAATAAEASSLATPSTSEGLALFASRETPRPSPLEGNPSAQFSSASQALPLPRYRKSVSGSSNAGGPSVSFSSPPLPVSASASSIAPIPQREFFQGLTDDSGYHLHHHPHHSQQQPLRYPTLMRASASRNVGVDFSPSSWMYCTLKLLIVLLLTSSLNRWDCYHKSWHTRLLPHVHNCRRHRHQLVLLWLSALQRLELLLLT